MSQRSIAIMTGGGDAPGLNAVIRAVVKRGVSVLGWRVVGIRNSLDGLFTDPPGIIELEPRPRARHPAVRRDDPRHDEHRQSVPVRRRRARRRTGAPRSSTRLRVDRVRGPHRDRRRRHDGDLRPAREASTGSRSSGSRRRSTTTSTRPSSASGSTPRWPTRPTPSTGSTRRPSRTTASWSSRSWGATRAGSRSAPGIAGGADAVLIPEIPFSLEPVIAKIHRRKAVHRGFSIVVVAEGAVPVGGRGVHGEDLQLRAR